ncbi:MAG: hypothetical protein AVDCRST_MAG10-1735, partial [uncultured Acidimicrobiales bacterium]
WVGPGVWAAARAGPGWRSNMCASARSCVWSAGWTTRPSRPSRFRWASCAPPSASTRATSVSPGSSCSSPAPTAGRPVACATWSARSTSKRVPGRRSASCARLIPPPTRGPSWPPSTLWGTSRRWPGSACTRRRSRVRARLRPATYPHAPASVPFTGRSGRPAPPPTFGPSRLL